MTTEQKAKAYDEALEKAKKLQKTCDSQAVVGWCEHIFPELKESDDERIRKTLIENFKWFRGDFPETTKWGKDDNLLVKDIIAWLERQSHDGKKWIYEDVYIKEKEQLIQDGIDEVMENPQKYGLEKQGDTNETINKESFAQGVLRGAAINLITWIDYNAAEGNMCLSNMECKDIEDALVSGDWDKIYAYMKKKLEKQGQVKESDILQQEEKTCKENDNSLTSEQRVEEAMRELEEKSKVYMEAHKEAADDFIALCRGEQKPDWSEEDERQLNIAMESCQFLNKIETVDWLKSLKERITNN